MTPRHWSLVTAVIAVAAFGAGIMTYWYEESQRPHFVADIARIEGYAASADGRELTILGSVGERDLLDVPSATEEQDRVVVKLPSLRFVPANGGFKNLAAYFVQARVALRDPLGNRTVIDGTTGRVVPRTSPPP